MSVGGRRNIASLSLLVFCVLALFASGMGVPSARASSAVVSTVVWIKQHPSGV